MKRFAFLLACAALLAAPLAACNDVGSCPAASQIKPGGSCSGTNLECPYTLDTPSPACDGTTVEGGLQTSCTCQNGTWSCPSPVSCDATTGEDASGDGTTSSEASDGPSTSDGQGGDAGEEAAPEAASEASPEAATDASGE